MLLCFQIEEKYPESLGNESGILDNFLLDFVSGDDTISEVLCVSGTVKGRVHEVHMK